MSTIENPRTDAPSSPDGATNFEKKSHKGRNAFIASAAGIAIVAGGLGIGLGAAGAGEKKGNLPPKNDKNSSETANPSPENTQNANVLPTGLENAANAPDLQTFNSLPQAERLAFCSYETRDMAEIAKGWKDTTKNSLDSLPTLNGNNSAQELLQVAAYNIRAPWLAHQGGDVVYDKLTADKVMSCALTNPASNYAKKSFALMDKAYDDNQAGQSVGTYARMNVLQTPTVTGNPESSVVNGNPTITTDVVFPDGTTDVATLTTIKGLDYEKKPTYFVTLDFKN